MCRCELTLLCSGSLNRVENYLLMTKNVCAQCHILSQWRFALSRVANVFIYIDLISSADSLCLAQTSGLKKTVTVHFWSSDLEPGSARLLPMEEGMIWDPMPGHAKPCHLLQHTAWHPDQQLHVMNPCCIFWGPQVSPQVRGGPHLLLVCLGDALTFS